MGELCWKAVLGRLLWGSSVRMATLVGLHPAMPHRVALHRDPVSLTTCCTALRCVGWIPIALLCAYASSVHTFKLVCVYSLNTHTHAHVESGQESWLNRDGVHMMVHTCRDAMSARLWLPPLLVTNDPKLSAELVQARSSGFIVPETVCGWLLKIHTDIHTWTRKRPWHHTSCDMHAGALERTLVTIAHASRQRTHTYRQSAGTRRI